MSTESSASLRVAVVGAGLGGLFLALFLQKNCPHIRVDIYESAHELTEVGAGIGMFPRVWEILKTLDIEEDLVTVIGAANGQTLPVKFFKSDEPKPVPVCEFPATMRPCHRSQLQQLLAKHLRAPSETLHFSKRLASYTEPASPTSTDPIVLCFKDGTEATCDVLVGSDGIRSAVRRTMYSALADAESDAAKAGALRTMVEPVWSGVVVHRGLVPAEVVGAENAQRETQGGSILIGKNMSIVKYPIAHGKLINIAAFVATPGGEGTVYEGEWVTSAVADEVAQKYASWDPEVPKLLKHMQKPLLWAIHRVRHLPTYVKGRAAIIGDAAHAMTPFQASGAGQAIEDGYVLASLLAHPGVTKDTLPAALKVYDAVRRPFAQNVQRLSDENGHTYHLYRHGWETLSAEESAAGKYTPEMVQAIGDSLLRVTEWAVKGSAMEEREKALALLKVELAGSR